MSNLYRYAPRGALFLTILLPIMITEMDHPSHTDRTVVINVPGRKCYLSYFRLLYVLILNPRGGSKSFDLC